MQDLGDGSDLGAADGSHGEPLELVVVELVGVVDRRQISGVDDKQVAPQSLGPVAVGHPGQADQHSCTVRSSRFDLDITGTGFPAATGRPEP